MASFLHSVYRDREIADGTDQHHRAYQQRPAVALIPDERSRSLLGSASLSAREASALV